MPVLKDVTIMYCKVQQPTLAFESKKRYEYTVDAAVSKATAKAWSKQYPKQKHKEFDNDEFTKIFKIEAPFPDQDEQFVIKLKKKADYEKYGKVIKIPDACRPRVFEKGDDGKLVDVTATKLVANGSKGVIQFEETTNKFGTFAQLKAVRVDEMIEYKSAGVSYDELGEVGELCEFAPQPDAEETKPAKGKKTEDSFDDDFDEECPF